jgi:hypothetical protein
VTNPKLTKAVEALLDNPRLLRRFRRNPRSALARFRLTPEELAAVEDGDANRLIGQRMDLRVVTRKPLLRSLFATILLRHGAKLAPAAFAALVLAVWPGAVAHAEPPRARARRVRAARVLGGLRIRTIGRKRAIPNIRRARARARLNSLLQQRIGLRRAIRRVGGGCQIECVVD